MGSYIPDTYANSHRSNWAGVGGSMHTSSQETGVSSMGTMHVMWRKKQRLDKGEKQNFEIIFNRWNEVELKINSFEH